MAFLDPNCMDITHTDPFSFRHPISAQNPFTLSFNSPQQHQQQQQLQLQQQQQQQQQQQTVAQQPQAVLRNMATGKKMSDYLDPVQPMESFPFKNPMYYSRYGQTAVPSAKRLQCSFEAFSRNLAVSITTPPPPSVQYTPWGSDASGTLSDKTAAQETKRNALTSLPLMTELALSNSTKYAYKPAGLQELYMWYITRQQLHLRNHGHRAIVENLVIYLEGLKVTYRDTDISLSETSTYGHTIIEGGPLPHQAFRDNLVIETNTQPSKTCSFIIDSVVNFLHTGTLGSLCMMETISSYFIPIHNGDGLTQSEIYEADVFGKVGFKKLTGGYKPGECGSLSINGDGTYTLKSYGILLVIGLDFVAASVKPVFIERLTTSSIRLMHPSGNYSLPKHVLRYKNRPIGPDLTLPTERYPGTHVTMKRVHC